MAANSQRRFRLSSVIVIALGSALLGGLGTAIVMNSPLGGNASAAPGQTAAGQAEPGAEQQQTASGVPDLARRIDGDPTALGAVDAPVVMIEYADYRCPFCSLFARDTMPKIMEQYLADGTLRIEWRDLPIFGEQSVQTAIAARAAGDQGLFWEYNAAVAAAAPERGHPDIDRAMLIGFAEQVGVPDLAAFELGLDSETHRAAVQADLQEAQSIGATSTPLFLIGDEGIAGAHPLETFQDVIERQAARP
ncbi:DsbA family protein [Microterricola viridarii]|uniref:Protein-disulfide isomerase n=1 Tax=Microterricola viridarii TaxID=412690 RepID=A0A1H1SPE6_9MICO|nr:thioredoxin domain-containing protein [Microterricola viridarii]SDS49279.1 Protein-disulfide isomerase [Microterricola viridarii]